MPDIAQAAPVNLIIPGIDGSNVRHWQTMWEATRTDCARVDLGDWAAPEPSRWMARLDRAVQDQAGPTRLVAHSLGCILVAWWAHHHPASARKVAGALLVAPCDPASDIDPRLHCFDPVPGDALPFPVLVAASSNDPYATPGWTARFARRLGGKMFDVGHIGHINAESGIGAWRQGQKLLEHIPRGSTEPGGPSAASHRHSAHA